jgi:hypothetical protein
MHGEPPERQDAACIIKERGQQQHTEGDSLRGRQVGHDDIGLSGA